MTLNSPGWKRLYVVLCAVWLGGIGFATMIEFDHTVKHLPEIFFISTVPLIALWFLGKGVAWVIQGFKS